MKLRSLLLLCAALFAPQKALPELVDWMTLRDQLFGVSPTYVFVLRETHDNLGRYGYGLRDTFLIARNIESGEDDQIWPVSRFATLSAAPEPSPLQNAISPFDILANNGGVPIAEAFNALGINLSREVPAALSWPISISVNTTVLQLQPYPEIEGIPSGEWHPMELLLGYTPDIESCKTVADMQLFPPFTNADYVQLHQIECFSAGRLVLSYIAIIR
jgi:hypothetical protein